jgi:hypothetical protein
MGDVMKYDKKTTVAIKNSLEHWERMVEKAKWLIESGLKHYSKWRSIFKKDFEYMCNNIKIDFYCTLCAKVSHSTNLNQFIESAEEYMIPVLKKLMEESNEYKP